MAGAVRQPIDVTSLSKYLATTLPDEIQLPISLKQVGLTQRQKTFSELGRFVDSALSTVWLWPVESHVPGDCVGRSKIRAEEEASGEAPVQDRASS